MPPVDEHGVLLSEPEDIISRRTVKVENKARVEILSRWHGQEALDATWEGYSRLKKDFPHLAGNVC